VAVEGIVGLVPFFGDVFDAVWKANQRNYALLEEHIGNPKRAVRSSRLFVTLVVAGLVAFMVLTAAGAFVVGRAIWHALS